MTIHVKYTLTEPQHSFIDSDKKFKLFFGGIGCGKSFIAWMAMFKHCVNNPGSLNVIVTPSYSNIKNVIYVIMDQIIPPQFIRSTNLSDKEVTFTNGSRIIFKSAADERAIGKLRGLTISAFWIDEATLLPDLIWPILVGRMRQPGMEYMGLVTSNPHKNWVYKRFIENGLNDDYFLLKDIPTETNTHLPQEYIDTLNAEYSGAWAKQELGGQFVDFEGLVYNFVTDELTQDKFTETLYGLDWGWTDPCAIVVIKKYEGRFYVTSEHYETGMNNQSIASELKAMYQIHGKGPVFCDPSAPATISYLGDRGIDARAAVNKREDGIRITSNMVNHNLFVSASCVNTLEEGSGYVFAKGAGKTSGTCHLMDALRYACMGTQTKRDVNRFTVFG